MSNGGEEEQGGKKQIFGQRKYLVHGGEKERRRKIRKTFGEGKYLFRGGEKERRMKRRKIFGPRRRKRTETKQDKVNSADSAFILLTI